VTRPFYASLFQWTFGTPITVGGRVYVPWDGGPGPGGDIVLPVSGEAIDWLPFVEVTSIAATLTQTVTLGGTVLVPSTNWVGTQKYAIIRDPAGARMGIWQL